MKRNLQSLVAMALVFTTFSVGKLQAQQDPYTTHYMFNRTMYNPAAVGAKDLYCATFLSHFQYLGYEDRTPEFYPIDASSPNSPLGVAKKNVGPKTQAFTFSAPITKYGGLGIGFISDRLGYENATHIKIAGAGRYPMLSGATIALGLEVNIMQKGLDGKQLKPLAAGDPKIPTSNVSDRHPIFSTGVYYNDPMANNIKYKDLWVGASVLGLNKPTFAYTGQGGGSSITFNTPATHLYVMGGVTMTDFMGNSDLEFLPSVMVKYNTVAQVDLTGLVRYQGKLWGGIAYRTTADAFSILLGYSGFKDKLQGLRVGYSYDLTLTKILSVSSGTHELQLNYCFTFEIPPKARIDWVTPPTMHRKSTY
jgi:type IX secretion system PorP/SprF family membrane protein